MLFSSKALLPIVSALFFLRGVSSIPVIPGGTGDDLIARRDFGDQAFFERRVTDTTALFKRDALDIDSDLFERADRDLLNQIDNAGSDGGRSKYKPGETKLRIGDGAKQELDRLNVHGKERKNVIKWHKKQVKNQMKTNPDLRNAHTGVIEHLAHKGGSQPKEKNHITASFKDSSNRQITNKWNGGPNHHLYVSNKGAGRQNKANLEKNNARLKNKATHNKGGSDNRLGKPSQKNGGKGKGQQRQSGASKKQDVVLRPKKGGKK